MVANSKYKDSVFSRLFSDPDILRELYGAIEGVAPPPDAPIVISRAPLKSPQTRRDEARKAEFTYGK